MDNQWQTAASNRGEGSVFLLFVVNIVFWKADDDDYDDEDDDSGGDDVNKFCRSRKEQ